MDYEFERQASMADRDREVAHLHLISQARGRKPRDDVASGIPEGSSKLNRRAAFIQLTNMFSALGLVASSGAKVQH